MTAVSCCAAGLSTTGGFWGTEAFADVVGPAGVGVEFSLVMFTGLDRGEGVFDLLFGSTARGGAFTILISSFAAGAGFRGAAWGLAVFEVTSFLAYRSIS